MKLGAPFYEITIFDKNFKRMMLDLIDDHHFNTYWT